MKTTPCFRATTATVLLVTCTLAASAARAQSAPAGLTLDESVASGANFDKAEFRLWLPAQLRTVRAVLVLVPGSNGDGRPMAQDSVWQAFAAAHDVALVACRFTDKAHDQSFIEEYVNVSRGTGQALLDAITTLATRSKHPELATAPFLMWGMSAGGQFNYEFVAWKPERVVAFVVNKGGIYYSALVPAAAREVPGILFVGGKDLEFRTNTIAGLFAVNRRAGALWAYAEEPSAAHVVGRSRDVALVLFEDVLALRLGDARASITPVPATGTAGGVSGPARGPEMRRLEERSGFIGDLKARTFQPLGDAKAPGYPTAWLPTARVARAWQGLVTEKP